MVHNNCGEHERVRLEQTGAGPLAPTMVTWSDDFIVISRTADSVRASITGPYRSLPMCYKARNAKRPRESAAVG